MSSEGSFDGWSLDFDASSLEALFDPLPWCNVSASSQFAQCGFWRGEVSQCFNSFEIPAAIKLQAFECQSENLSQDFKGAKEDFVGLSTCGLFPSQTFEHETVVPSSGPSRTCRTYAVACAVATLVDLSVLPSHAHRAGRRGHPRRILLHSATWKQHRYKWRFP